MPIRTDTTRTERRYITDMVAVEHGHTLEIGCGDGRMTWQYADSAHRITAIDVTPDELQTALSTRPQHLAQTVNFIEASAIRLPFADSAFDHVVFAWSL
jgi:ubiquinone/menaquinone biosynthesis C-methylase UbiE